MQYIVTFYTHFGATGFARLMHKCNRKATLAPVPRALSASCGTCAVFELNAPDELPPIIQSQTLGQDVAQDIEKVYRLDNGVYNEVYAL